MQSILHEIDMNNTLKRIELMNKELHNLSKDVEIMDSTLDLINEVHDKLLCRKEPVGSSSNAIKYLKLQR